MTDGRTGRIGRIDRVARDQLFANLIVESCFVEAGRTSWPRIKHLETKERAGALVEQQVAARYI